MAPSPPRARDLRGAPLRHALFLECFVLLLVLDVRTIAWHQHTSGSDTGKDVPTEMPNQPHVQTRRGRRRAARWELLDRLWRACAWSFGYGSDGSSSRALCTSKCSKGISRGGAREPS